MPCGGGKDLLAGAVAAGGALTGAFVTVRADPGGDFGVDEVLQAGLQQASERFLVGEARIVEEFLQASFSGGLFTAILKRAPTRGFTGRRAACE